MATKTIGLTGRDYSTMAAWASYANTLTLTAPEIAEVYNDGGPVVDTVAVVANGWSGASSTNTVTIRAAAGHSFKDNIASNPLRYSSAFGATLQSNVHSGGTYNFGNFAIVEGLQIVTGVNDAGHACVAGTNTTIRNCIIKQTGPNSVVSAGANVTIENCILHATGGGSGVIVNAASLVLTNNLFVASTNSGSGVRQQYSQSPAPLAKNNIVFGFLTDYQSTSHASSTNNATDKSSFGGTGWGASGQTSVTSSEWVSTTSGSENYKLSASAAKLKDTGTTSSVTTDIVGTARPQGAAYDIGPWEATAAAAALVATPTSTSTTTSVLSTLIKLAADLNSLSSTTAFLTDNGFNANAVSVSVTVAGLTTGIALATSLNSVSTTTSALTTSSVVGFDTPVLKNNTGTVLLGETGIIVNVYNVSTGALVLRKTGLSTNLSGVVSVRDITLVNGTTYAYEVVLTSNGRRLPTAVAS